METLVKQRVGVKTDTASIVSVGFVTMTSIIGISTFLSAMTIPTLPIAHSNGNIPNPISNFEDCLRYGEVVREADGLVCIAFEQRYPRGW